MCAETIYGASGETEAAMNCCSIPVAIRLTFAGHRTVAAFHLPLVTRAHACSRSGRHEPMARMLTYGFRLLKRRRSYVVRVGPLTAAISSTPQDMMPASICGPRRKREESCGSRTQFSLRYCPVQYTKRYSPGPVSGLLLSWTPARANW